MRRRLDISRLDLSESYVMETGSFDFTVLNQGLAYRDLARHLTAMNVREVQVRTFLVV